MREGARTGLFARAGRLARSVSSIVTILSVRPTCRGSWRVPVLDLEVPGAVVPGSAGIYKYGLVSLEFSCINLSGFAEDS